MKRLIFYSFIFFFGQQKIEAGQKEDVFCDAGLITITMRLRGVSVVGISYDNENVYSYISVEKPSKEFEINHATFFPKSKNKDHLYFVNVDGQGRSCYFYPGDTYTMTINGNEYLYTKDKNDKK